MERWREKKDEDRRVGVERKENEIQSMNVRVGRTERCEERKWGWREEGRRKTETNGGCREVKLDRRGEEDERARRRGNKKEK